MKTNERQLVPIAEAKAENVGFGKINLPEYVDVNQIGIDLIRLRTLMRIGGIANLGIDVVNDGNDDSSIPQIVGVDESGQATGGFARGGNYRPKVDQRYFSFGSYKTNVWAMARLTLNTGNISGRLADKNEGVRSVEGWCRELDEDLRRGIMSSGLKLLLKPNMDETFLLAFFTLLDYISGKGMGDIPSNMFDVAWLTYLVNLTFSPRHRMVVESSGLNYPGIRLSLLKILGMEFDRAAILAVMTQMRGLIRPIIKKEGEILDAE